MGSKTQRAVMAVLAFAVIFVIVVGLSKMFQRESFENGMVWCNKKGMMVPASECPCRRENP
jgi:type IV secretory pathway VirB2 component (pilin)